MKNQMKTAVTALRKKINVLFPKKNLVVDMRSCKKVIDIILFIRK